MVKRKVKSEKRRKRTLAVIGISLLTIAITLAGVFIVGFNSEEVKEYEAKTSETAEAFTEQLVSEIESTDTSDSALVTDNPPLAAPAGLITEAEKQVISQELAKLEDERKQRVLQTLSVTYSQILNQQKNQAFTMVDALLADAKAEYQVLVASGQDTAVNKGKLATEFLAKASVMESQMDASFYSLTGTIEQQLTSEGIEPDAIIAKYQSEYNSIKEANRSALMAKAMSALN